MQPDPWASFSHSILRPDPIGKIFHGTHAAGRPTLGPSGSLAGQKYWASSPCLHEIHQQAQGEDKAHLSVGSPQRAGQPQLAPFSPHLFSHSFTE